MEGECAILLNGVEGQKFLAPTKQNIEQAVAQMARRSGANDTIWFYFSGHGTSVGDKSYLVPEDAVLGEKMEASLISVSAIRSLMQKISARRKLLILDSCHSGSAKAIADGKSRWEDVLGSVAGVVTMAACQINQSALDTGKGSLFTNCLLQGIFGGAAQDGAKTITIGGLERFVREKVAAESLNKQTPVFMYQEQANTPIGQASPSALERLPSLANQTLLTRQPLKPGLIIFVAEEHIDANGAVTREPLLQALLQSSFVKDGFPVLIEEDASNFRVRLNAPDVAAAKKAAAQLNSRFLLRGTAKITPVPKRFEAQANFETVQAQVTVQLIDTEGGVLAVVVATESGRGVSDVSAIKMAVDRAAKKVHREIYDKVRTLLEPR